MTFNWGAVKGPPWLKWPSLQSSALWGASMHSQGGCAAPHTRGRCRPCICRCSLCLYLLAGTWRQYSKKAISQLRNIAVVMGHDFILRWRYHADVIKALLAHSRATVAAARPAAAVGMAALPTVQCWPAGSAHCWPAGSAHCCECRIQEGTLSACRMARSYRPVNARRAKQSVVQVRQPKSAQEAIHRANGHRQGPQSISHTPFAT